ncbi:hypothetical protein BASA81_015062 [Batrachochytrium salamandrivorans]|nr:hypothetical protein BASA81_015062 [Batrachochytrium salamandrivorans]
MLALGWLRGEVTATRLDTPLMGWSTWESLAKNVSDEHVMRNVRYLVTSGLQAKGYTMIQIDDGWQELNRQTQWTSRVNYPKRPNNKKALGGLPAFVGNGSPGCIVPDPIKFPRGMQKLGEELKANGMRFGLYTSGTKYACDAQSGFKGIYGSTDYADLRKYDAVCFRKWGIDLLKVDSCNPPSTSDLYNQGVMEFWRGALDNNVILYNSRFGCMGKTTCNNVYTCPLQTDNGKNAIVRAYCTSKTDLARTGPDVKPVWNSILGAISTMFGRGKVSKPGFWSDPDYLLPHATLLQFVERRSQFSMWCITSAPLLISVELTTMDKETLMMLSDDMAIGVNQLYEGNAGDIKSNTGLVWEFQKRFTLQTAVLAVNVGSNINSPTFSATELQVWRPRLNTFMSDAVLCEYVNVWTKETGVITADSEFEIKERDCLFLVVSNCVKELTLRPTVVGETLLPTSNPTSLPTASPTTRPSKRMTNAPTKRPTKAPITTPTKRPSLVPTKRPTKAPTTTPTKRPSLVPTTRPTKRPSTAPTKRPTKAPTTKPTKRPTSVPTKRATKVPTTRPTTPTTLAPTQIPSVAPTLSPTQTPSAAPTALPSQSPSAGPTAAPTASPTATPTASPTVTPTASPTVTPSSSPTISPTSPTSEPTTTPTSTAQEEDNNGDRRRQLHLKIPDPNNNELVPGWNLNDQRGLPQQLLVRAMQRP